MKLTHLVTSLILRQPVACNETAAWLWFWRDFQLFQPHFVVAVMNLQKAQTTSPGPHLLIYQV